eukprot:2012013-Prymnesium_polylepis.1
MAAAPRARAAAEALARFEFCRLLSGGDWRAGLPAAAPRGAGGCTGRDTATARRPRRGARGPTTRASRSDATVGGAAPPSAAALQERRAAVARLFSSGAVAGGGLDARGEQTQRTEGGRWVLVSRHAQELARGGQRATGDATIEAT